MTGEEQEISKTLLRKQTELANVTQAAISLADMLTTLELAQERRHFLLDLLTLFHKDAEVLTREIYQQKIIARAAIDIFSSVELR